MKSKIITTFLISILILLAGACSPAQPTQDEVSQLIPTTAQASPSPSPSATQTPTPSQTLTPTITQTASQTPTTTPTLHPMNILAARQTTYPGSEITIQQTLTAAVGYHRYYAWYESEGLKIYGLLTIPKGEMPPNGWPAIVFNHGYIPPEVYVTTERYTAYVDNLARNGYIVFRIDYRGHDRSEGEPVSAYGDPGYLVDVLNAVASLRRYPDADPERIGMWGHSMGGYLTLRAMVIDPGIKAGVIWAGVVASYPDLVCCWRRTPGVPTPTLNPTQQARWRGSWADVYGTPEENPDFWLGISANSYLEDISGPLQLHHGTADTSVPIAFSQSLYEQMNAAGQTVEYYEYQGDDHNLATFFGQAMTRTLKFYEMYLKNTSE